MAEGRREATDGEGGRTGSRTGSSDWLEAGGRSTGSLTIMAAVTVPPVTKSTALSDYLFGKQGHRVLVPQPHWQHLMILPTDQEGGG